MLRLIRSAVLTARSRVAERLPHLTAHDLAEIDAEFRAALSTLGGGG
jgi:hypothetical protein